jgi:hypothetical protein
MLNTLPISQNCKARRVRLLALSPFKVASDSNISVLILYGPVSLRGGAKIKRRSLALGMPSLAATFSLTQAEFLSSPFQDVFGVIHSEWIRFSVDFLASVGTVDRNRRKHADLAEITVSFCLRRYSDQKMRRDNSGHDFR